MRKSLGGSTGFCYLKNSRWQTSSQGGAAIQISLVQVLALLPFVVYFAIGIRLTNQAERHLRDPNKTHWFTPMYEPELFTDEGNRLRVKALRFWLWGGAALALYVFIF